MILYKEIQKKNKNAKGSYIESEQIQNTEEWKRNQLLEWTCFKTIFESKYIYEN